MPKSSNNSDKSVFDWPSYWFVRLEKAVKEGDHQAAAEAQRELALLGVRVNYGAEASRKEAADGK